MKGKGTFVTIKEKGLGTRMPKKKKYNTDVLTLGAIWRAYCFAEREFVKNVNATQKTHLFGVGADPDVRILEYPLNYERNKTQKCKAKNSTVPACYGFLVPDNYRLYLDNFDPAKESVFSTDLMTGGQRADVSILASHFMKVEDADEMFMVYEKHLKLILSHVVRILTYIIRKNTVTGIYIEQQSGSQNSKQKNRGKSVEIELTVEEADNLPVEAFNREFETFVSDMLDYLLKSDPYQNDLSIKASKIEDVLKCDQINSLEKLTLFSILSLFSKDTIKDAGTRQDFFDTLSYALFDGNGIRKTPSKSCVKTKPVRIDRETIYESGKYWYENTKKQGHRFSKLIPNRELLPLAGTLPIQVHAENQNDRPLMEVIEETSGHLYLIGEGGIGKTTALYSILEDAYGFENPSIIQIPIYVELSKARSPKDFDLTEGAESSLYIRNSIQRQLKAYLRIKDDLLSQMEELFTLQKSTQEYVLLLDGLNEVSRDVLGKGKKPIITMVVAEIQYILKQYTNVRIILTSRSEERFGDNITSIYLAGIEPKMIEQYLENRKPEKQIIRIKNNKRLMDILRIPLFLTLYAELDGEEEYLSRGEILHAFFTKRKTGYYSFRNRLYDIRDGVTEETGIDNSDGVTPEILCFMLDFVLPEIAWYMVQNNRFQIKRKEIRDIVENVLSDEANTSVCGMYGIECFDEYYTETDDTKEIAKTITAKFSKTSDTDKGKWDSISKKICQCLKYQLGVLQTNDTREYVFIHHHIRDYFAALHHINRLRLACYIFKERDTDTARQCLNEWIESPLLLNQLSLIGEALGEPRNAPLYNEENEKWIYCVPEVTNECDRNLIKRTLDIYRHRFDGEDGYTVWNLFQILKLTREDLSGEDLSYLDLSFCRANGFRLGNGSFACRLKGAKLNDMFFMPMGHTSMVTSAEYSPDGKYILTSSLDVTARVWDAKTFQEIPDRMIRGVWGFAHYRHPDGRFIVAKSQNSVRVFDIENNCREIPESPIEYAIPVESAEYSPDGKDLLIMSWDGTMELRDGDSLELKEKEKYTEWSSMAEYSPQGKYIILSCREGIVKFLNAKTLKEVPNATLKVDNENTDHVASSLYSEEKPTPIPSDEFFVGVDCSQNEKYLAVATNHTVKIYDLENLQDGPVGIPFHHASDKDIYFLKFCPDDMHRLLICDRNEGVSIWDTVTCQEIINNHFPYSYVFQYSPKGRYILSVSDVKGVEVWDALTLQKVPGGELKYRDIIGGQVEVSPDGRYMVSYNNGSRKTVIWDLISFQTKPLLCLNGIDTLRFSKNGKYFVTTSGEKYATVWDTNTMRRIPEGKLTGHTDIVLYAEFSQDAEGKYIITSSRDGTSKIWNTKNFKEVSGGTLTESCDGVVPNRAHFSPDGKNILTIVRGKTATIWEKDEFDKWIIYKRNDEFKEYNRVEQYISKGLLIQKEMGAFELRDAKSFRVMETSGCREIIASINYSENEQYKIVIRNHEIKVLDTKTNQDISKRKPINHKNANLAKFCAHDRYIITASEDGEIKLWDAETHKEVHTMHYISGLETWNVDIRHLHEQSDISEEVKGYLKEYGAIID